MFTHSHDSASLEEVPVVPEVIEYINRRDCDFRICTSCGGPILLPTRVKPPKKTDLLLKAGNHTIYVSIHQARYLNSIRMDMIPFFDDDELARPEYG
jgi:MoaA/NifB/PqqE/SkfB family radical SAM enzyme